MDCEGFLEGYSDFLDGQLEEHPFSEYTRHLQACPDCAEYHRVMRRGLRLVRQLDPPETAPDFAPRLELHHFDSSGRGATNREYARAVMVAGLTAVSLLFFASLPVMRPGGGAVELPPVVIETPAVGNDRHSLWGPPPTFTSQASFLQVPSFNSNALMNPPREGFSLFRTTQRDSLPPKEIRDLAPE
jgi:hypothetical protein